MYPTTSRLRNNARTMYTIKLYGPIIPKYVIPYRKILRVIYFLLMYVNFPLIQRVLNEFFARYYYYYYYYYYYFMILKFFVSSSLRMRVDVPIYNPPILFAERMVHQK